MCSAPYHPASDGALVKLVQIFKKAIKTAVTLTLLLQVFCCLTIQHRIASLMKFLASCIRYETFEQDWTSQL